MELQEINFGDLENIDERILNFSCIEGKKIKKASCTL
jgi:hypothetical protein